MLSIGFVFSDRKSLSMKKQLLYLLPVLYLLLNCEDTKRQQNYKIDLFADERQEGKAYVMNEKECFDASDLVLSTAQIKPVDSSSGRGKSVFIYRISSGEVLKTTRDSIIAFPLQIISGQRLKLKSPMYVYLKKLEGYRFIAKEKNLKYQWLKGAPVYPVKAEK